PIELVHQPRLEPAQHVHVRHQLVDAGHGDAKRGLGASHGKILPQTTSDGDLQLPLNLDPEQSSDSLSASLLALCGEVASTMPLPAVDHIYLPPPQVAGEKSRKFGLVVLKDRSTGFFFTLLGDERGDEQVPA